MGAGRTHTKDLNFELNEEVINLQDKQHVTHMRAVGVWYYDPTNGGNYVFLGGVLRKHNFAIAPKKLHTAESYSPSAT